MTVAQQAAALVMAVICIGSTLVQVGIFVGVMTGVREELKLLRDTLGKERDERSKLAERVASIEGRL